MRYSERLGELSLEQLQAALDRFGLGRLVEAESAAHGLFGQVVLIATDRGAWALRGNPHEGQLVRERFVARWIHERTDLEAPWPYHLETSPELFGWPYALMRRIPGVVSGADGPAERRDLARALGEGLARLHALEVEAPGYVDPVRDALVPYPVDHETRVVGAAHDWLARCRDARPEAIAEADVSWIDEVIAANRAALREPFTPTLVHHDYKPNNVLCERAPSGWRVNGVVDLGESYFGDPEEDLVRSVASFARVDTSCARSFVASYAVRRPLRPGLAERFRIYQLVDCLVMWEYGQRNRVWFPPGLRLRAFAEPAVSELDPFRG